MIIKQFVITVTLEENVANERLQRFIRYGISTEQKLRPSGEEMSSYNLKVRSVKPVPVDEVPLLFPTVTGQQLKLFKPNKKRSLDTIAELSIDKRRS